MGRILLTDGQQRKTLAAARSLGRRGDRVWVADVTAFSTSRFSRFCHQGLVCPHPEDKERFWAWLLATVERNGLEVLAPMDDLTTALAVERQAGLPRTCRTLLPAPEQFAAVQDKAATARLAARAGVRAPRTFEVTDRRGAVAAVEALGGKAVLKPRYSSGGRGIEFVHGPVEVERAWARAEARPDWGGLLVQERVPLGRKFDVCLLYGSAGDLRATFVQEELRWFPLESGASTLQESVDRPDLVDLGARLLAPVGWRGPVEVEFMLDPAGEPVLMEVNPRFWASLALAVQCGVDFPSLTVDLALGRDVWGPAAYPVGRRCRWLLPGDLLHAIAKRGRGMDPPFFATYDGRTFDDIVSREDPGPTLGVLLAMVRYFLDPAMWRLLMRW